MADPAAWPITYEDVTSAQHRLAAYLSPTPLRSYPLLDEALGVHVLVKHECHQPTGAFKVRNGLAALTAMRADELSLGVVAATMGNYGQGLAWAGQRLGAKVTICVPHGVNPDKMAAMRGFGAELVQEGDDFDEALDVMDRLVDERGLIAVHGVNHPMMPAGAGTITLEVVEQAAGGGEAVDTMVISIGGGSQAVGAMTVLRHRQPGAKVIGVQAAGASTIHDGWQQKKPLVGDRPNTIAEGVATRQTYELTFGALCDGLADFVLISDSDMAEAMRLIWRTTHHLVEPAGAAGIAAVSNLRKQLAGQTVVVIFSGANVDGQTARSVFAGEI